MIFTVVLGIAIGADLEQDPDERQRAMVDRVLEARPDRQRHGAIGDAVGILDGRP